MKKYIVAGMLLAIYVPANAQSSLNPDISIIGDSRIWKALNLPEGSTNKINLEMEELEIAAGGYLNPYARADVILALPGNGEIEIEEAYATLLRGLPWNLQVRAGQYLVDFGKLNTRHPHQWSWIERPLMNQMFLGDEGLKDMGINVTSLIPVGSNALTISASLLDGNSLLGEDFEGDDYRHAGNLRASLFVASSEFSSIEVGLFGLIAETDTAIEEMTKFAGVDLKYRWKPDSYRVLTISAEGLMSNREVPSEVAGTLEKVSSSGAFMAIDYRFRKRFNAGAFLDYSQSPLDETIDQTGYGLFGGFSLVEETYRLELLLRQDDGTEFTDPIQTVILRFLWSLGPHKPHVF
jgi:hypothetical protein